MNRHRSIFPHLETSTDRNPGGFEAGPTENPEDENVEMDPDENLPWPDQDLIKKWWSARQGNFAKGSRYLLGQPISTESLAWPSRTATSVSGRLRLWSWPFSNQVAPSSRSGLLASASSSFCSFGGSLPPRTRSSIHQRASQTYRWFGPLRSRLRSRFTASLGPNPAGSSCVSGGYKQGFAATPFTPSTYPRRCERPESRCNCLLHKGLG